MKNENIKKSIRGAITLFASRELAFIYCLIGTIAQVAHTYYLTSGISSLQGGGKISQAVILSAFISTSLLYFVSVTDDGESKKSKNNRLAVILFVVIEILINLYYYSRHLLIENIDNGITVNNYFDFGFAIIISTLIPIIIKLYASHIRALEWLNAVNEVDKVDSQIDDNFKDNLKLEIIQDIKDNDTDNLNNTINNKIDEKINDIDQKIEESFQRNSDFFIKQFQNKIKSQK